MIRSINIINILQIVLMTDFTDTHSFLNLKRPFVQSLKYIHWKSRKFFENATSIGFQLVCCIYWLFWFKKKTPKHTTIKSQNHTELCQLCPAWSGRLHCDTKVGGDGGETRPYRWINVIFQWVCPISSQFWHWNTPYMVWDNFNAWIHFQTGL